MYVGLFKIRPQLTNTWASLIAQLVKNLPAVQETPVQFLGQEDPLDKGDRLPTPVFLGFPCGSDGKESACDVGDLGSIPGLERPPGEGKGYLLQYSGIVHGVAQSDTTKRLSLHFTNTFYFFSVFFLSGIYLNSFYCCVFKFIYLLVISNLPLVICSVL